MIKPGINFGSAQIQNGINNKVQQINNQGVGQQISDSRQNNSPGASIDSFVQQQLSQQGSASLDLRRAQAELADAGILPQSQLAPKPEGFAKITALLTIITELLQGLFQGGNAASTPSTQEVPQGVSGNDIEAQKKAQEKAYSIVQNKGPAGVEEANKIMAEAGVPADQMKANIDSAFKKRYKGIKGKIRKGKDKFKKIGSNIKKGFQGIGNGITKGLKGIGNGLKKGAIGILKAPFTILKGVGNVYEGIGNGISNLASKVGNAATTVVTKLAGLPTNISAKVADAFGAQNIAKGLRGVNKLIEGTVGAVSGFAIGTATGVVKSASNVLSGYGQVLSAGSLKEALAGVGKAGLGALDVATTVGVGGLATQGIKQGIKQSAKQGAKHVAKVGANHITKAGTQKTIQSVLKEVAKGAPQDLLTQSVNKFAKSGTQKTIQSALKEAAKEIPQELLLQSAYGALTNVSSSNQPDTVRRHATPEVVKDLISVLSNAQPAQGNVDLENLRAVHELTYGLKKRT